MEFKSQDATFCHGPFGTGNNILWIFMRKGVLLILKGFQGVLFPRKKRARLCDTYHYYMISTHARWLILKRDSGVLLLSAFCHLRIMCLQVIFFYEEKSSSVSCILGF